MLGDQVKSLMIISKAKGWDPNIIPARDDKPAVDISNWNKSPQSWEMSDDSGQWTVRNKPIEVYGTPSVGDLPQEIVPTNRGFSESEGPKYEESITFEVPDASRENANRRTSGGDAFPGGGWGGL